jgi:beta-aspartyl-peptidase (threonine type)
MIAKLKPVIVVHGGAGRWNESEYRLEEAVAACRNAAKAGQGVLIDGGPALDAVEVTVRLLEDSPILDAGHGSYLNAAGQIEMDALIMDGETMDMGAIAAVQLIRNPVSLARLVMTESQHSFLVAAGAEAFADAMGFPRCSLSDLLNADQLELMQSGFDPDLYASHLQPDEEMLPGDTVGAVALDISGNLAAATSTGGTKAKQPGRVGDSPLVGSGAYADNWTAAVSATGYGEALMKVLISKRVCDFVADGLSIQKACEAAIDVLHERVNGQGGLISVDIRGRIGIAYNTMAMPYAYARGDEPITDGF